ncbi:exonuclease domain-containing protein [Ensifer sp. LCM 4579]|uniref:exonuclease domain-containing protein n=1 Tax=Ensifer sp. LCM 4579 TaxID=1848292 RepID=UPI0009F22B02
MTQQFDLFVANETAPAKVAGSSAMKRHAPKVLSEADMVRQLQETGRYRILKKPEPRCVTAAARPGFPLKGVILDTETTGLNYRKDEIIEIGAIAFTFDDAGAIGDVTGVYGGLQRRPPPPPPPPKVVHRIGTTPREAADRSF